MVGPREALHAFVLNGFRKRPGPSTRQSSVAFGPGSPADTDFFPFRFLADPAGLVHPGELSARATQTLEGLRALTDRERLELGRWLEHRPDPSAGTGWRFDYSTCSMTPPRGEHARDVAWGILFAKATWLSWHHDDTIDEHDWDYDISRDGDPFRPREAAQRLLIFGWMLGVAYANADEDVIDALFALASSRLPFPSGAAAADRVG